MRTLAALSLLLLLLLTGLAMPSGEITRAIDAIGERYDEVKAGIEDEECFYRTRVIVNTEDSFYPVVGQYGQEITFYWTDEGGHLWLHFVAWTERHASRRDYGEVLFPAPGIGWEDGQEHAAFEYVFSHDWDGNDTEYRWWWTDEGWMLWSTAVTVTPDSSVIEGMPEEPGEYSCFWTPEALLELFSRIHH